MDERNLAGAATPAQVISMSECFDDTKLPLKFQSIGSVAARVVDRIAVRLVQDGSTIPAEVAR